MKKILVVGITPPPYYGQAMMTERLVNARFDNIKIYHVRMAFSKSLSSVGTFAISKLLHMIEIVAKAFYYKYRYQINILYYMPGGFNFTPVARDIFILFFLRLIFKKTILHFRAAGVSGVVDRQPFPLKQLAKYVYCRPELAIHLSELNPDDGGYFEAKKTMVVPNGLEDAAQEYLPIHRPQKECVTILYVGIIQETKGVMVLLEATKLLKERKLSIRVNLVGGFNSLEFEEQVINYCRQHNLMDIVSLVGIKTGEEKWKYFREADIFCFPSYYECESFGNVVVEAMMFELPVVATEWRGIASIVDHKETGLLVPIKDPEATSNALAELIEKIPVRKRFGEVGRRKYDQTYRVDRFLNTISHVLDV